MNRTPSPRPTRKSTKASRARGDEDRGVPLGASKKSITILELVAASREPVPMAELIRRTGLTKPTAHRITSALAEIGLLERDHFKRGYIEGPRLIKLALNTLAAAAPRALRHSILRAISESVGETCNFGVLAGSEVIYLDRVEAKWPLGLRFEAGSRVPAHCTAIGKLLLSRLPAQERDSAVSVLPLASYTSHTITSRDALLRALQRIAQTEIGTDEQEFIAGVVCVAVPVLSPARTVIGALAISAPHARVTLDRLLEFVPDMREAAERLGATFDVPADGLAEQSAAEAEEPRRSKKPASRIARNQAHRLPDANRG